MSLPSPAWMEDAKCTNAVADGEITIFDADALFFPDQTGKTAGRQFCTGRDGKGACPVQSECLEFALSTNSNYGVWGGLSERSRRKRKMAANGG